MFTKEIKAVSVLKTQVMTQPPSHGMTDEKSILSIIRPNKFGPAAIA
jgi:hypothetical protein